jgi:hypothetical protein
VVYVLRIRRRRWNWPVTVDHPEAVEKRSLGQEAPWHVYGTREQSSGRQGPKKYRKVFLSSER